MAPENLYQSPRANLSTDSPERQTIQKLYDEQNGIAAVVAAAAGSLLLAALWSELAPGRPLFTPMILVVSGILTGLIVRFAGRPVTAAPRVGALLFQLYTAFLAVFVIGAPVVSPRGVPTPMIVYFGLLIAGAAVAYTISARPLSPEEKRVLWKHDHSIEPPRDRLRNRPWIMAIIGLLCASTAFAIAAVWAVWDLPR